MNVSTVITGATGLAGSTVIHGIVTRPDRSVHRRRGVPGHREMPT